MKYIKIIIRTFIILSANILFAQSNISETKIITKNGELIVKKSINGENSFITLSSSINTDENCQLVDYSVYVTFNIESDCSISSYEISHGKIKCLDDAIEEFCKEIILKTKEKNIRGLFSTDLSKCKGKYRFPIKIHTE